MQCSGTVSFIFVWIRFEQKRPTKIAQHTFIFETLSKTSISSALNMRQSVSVFMPVYWSTFYSPIVQYCRSMYTTVFWVAVERSDPTVRPKCLAIQSKLLAVHTWTIGNCCELNAHAKSAIKLQLTSTKTNGRFPQFRSNSDTITFAKPH